MASGATARSRRSESGEGIGGEGRLGLWQKAMATLTEKTQVGWRGVGAGIGKVG